MSGETLQQPQLEAELDHIMDTINGIEDLSNGINSATYRLGRSPEPVGEDSDQKAPGPENFLERLECLHSRLRGVRAQMAGSSEALFHLI